MIDKDGVLSIIKAGLPILLMQMNPADMPKNVIKVNMFKVLGSKNGEYAALQSLPKQGLMTWYI